MKMFYDPKADALSVRLTDTEIAASAEVRPGLVVDLDEDGPIVGFEILDARAPLPKGTNLLSKFETAA